MSVKKPSNIQGLIDENGEVLTIPEGKRVVFVGQDESIITQKQIEYAIVHNKRREDTTNFIWVKFKYNQTLYPFIKNNVVARMFCLATYTDNDGYTAAKTNIKICLNNINDDLITELLDITSREGIIVPVKGKYKVNPRCFYRGDMKESDDNHIRLFTDTTRSLFASCKTTKHCYITYILQMIPFVNRKTNILCYNQTELDNDHIEHQAFKQYLSVIGVNSGGTHTSRIRKEILNFRINGELAVGFFNDVSTMKFVPSGKYAVVNPILFYGGDRTDNNYSRIRSLFENERKLNLEITE